MSSTERPEGTPPVGTEPTGSTLPVDREPGAIELAYRPGDRAD